MKHPKINTHGNFLIKLAAAAAMVAAGDLLFWQNGLGGGFIGLYGLILVRDAAHACR